MFIKVNHKIPTLAECRAIAAAKPEFIEIAKSDYIVFDYAINDSHTFDFPSSLEMRGIAFNAETGELVGLGLHKFFNLGEKPDQKLVLSSEAEALEKIDGSMIRVIRTNTNPRGWVLGTRAGETTHSQYAEDFIADKPKYVAFIDACIAGGIHPIFEYWSPLNSVVIRYAEPFLHLIAMRNRLGDYLSYKDMKHIADSFGYIDIANSYTADIKSIISSYHQLKGIEGFVIRSNSGWVKLKTDEYCQLHKAVSKCQFDKDIAEMVLSGTIDDAIALLPSPRKEEVSDLRDKIVHFMTTTKHDISSSLPNLIAETNGDRKSIALKIVDDKFRAEIFAALDGKLESTIKKRIFTASRTLSSWETFAKDFL